MELTDWTAGIDKQTEENNLRNSPEGQMAYKRGLAELALVQGNVQEQSMRIDAQKREKDFQARMLAAQAQRGKQEADGKDPTKQASDLDYIQNDIDNLKFQQKFAMENGRTAEAAEYSKQINAAMKQKSDIETKSLQQNKIRLDAMEKTTTEVVKLAGAALEGKSYQAISTFVNQASAKAKELQSMGIPVPTELQQVLQNPTMENIAMLRDRGLTANQQMKDAKGQVAANATRVFDKNRGEWITVRANSADSMIKANDAIERSKQAANGKESSNVGNAKSAYIALGGDWDSLTPSQQKALEGDYLTTRSKVSSAANSVQKPKDIDKTAMAIVKGAHDKADNQADKARRDQMTPEQRAADLQNPKPKWSDAQLNNWAEQHREQAGKDKQGHYKVTLEPEAILRMAKDEMNGKPRPGGLGAEDNAALENMKTQLRQNGMEEKTVLDEKLGPYVRNVAKDFGIDQSSLAGMSADEKRTFVGAHTTMKKVEDASKFIDDHPEAVGTLAAITKDIGNKTFQLFDNSDKTEYSANDVASTMEKKYNLAGDAAVLNKKLVTLALADVQTLAGGRMNKYLEQTMVGLYNQAYSKDSLQRILHDRETEAFNKINDADDTLTKDRVSKDKYPFFHRDIEGATQPKAGAQNLAKPFSDAEKEARYQEWKKKHAQ